jgi:hypothetical protein
MRELFTFSVHIENAPMRATTSFKAIREMHQFEFRKQLSTSEACNTHDERNILRILQREGRCGGK